MSHFGRSGPPDISDTYSLLVLNITFRTTADDLYPLFAKYGKVVDIFIPRDRRTGDSRGFAFVRYKHVDEAEKAVQRLDALADMQISLSKLQPADIVLILSISTGRNVDGRDIVVQFAKYGPNAEAIAKGRVSHESFRQKTSRSRSPRRSRYRDGDDYHRERDYRYRDGRPRERDYRRRSRSRSRSLDRSGRYRDRERDHRRLPSRSLSRGRSRSPSRSRSRSRSSSRDYSRRPRKSRSRSPERKGSSPRERRSVDRRSPSLDRHPSSSPSPRRRSSDKSVSPPPIRSVSPVNHRQRRPSRSPSRDSRSPLSGNSDH